MYITNKQTLSAGKRENRIITYQSVFLLPVKSMVLVHQMLMVTVWMRGFL